MDKDAWLKEYLDSIKESIDASDQKQSAALAALDKKFDDKNSERKELEKRVTALENFKIKAVAYATAASAALVYLPKYLLGFTGLLIK